MSATPGLVRAAQRRPLQGASAAAMLGACALGTAGCEAEGVLLAALAGVAALALLVPVLAWNRPTLPLALVVGAVPALLSLRDRPFPAYGAVACGLLLVASGELAARSWYVHSLAPRGRAGGWTGSTAVVIGAGALAAIGVMAAARTVLDGAVMLTAIGAGALVVAGAVALRASRR